MGGTLKSVAGIKPIGQEKEGFNYDEKVETPERERAYQARGSSRFKGKDKMLGLEALNHWIVKQGKRLLGKHKVSEGNTDDQPYNQYKPRGRSLRQDAGKTEKSSEKSFLSEKMSKEVNPCALKLPYVQQLSQKKYLIF